MSAVTGSVPAKASTSATSVPVVTETGESSFSVAAKAAGVAAVSAMARTRPGVRLSRRCFKRGRGNRMVMIVISLTCRLGECGHEVRCQRTDRQDQGLHPLWS